MIGQAHISVKASGPEKTWGALKLKVICDYLQALLDMECMLKGEFTVRDRALGVLKRAHENPSVGF